MERTMNEITKKPRFPIPRYPRGWFQVAYTDEIEPGGVMPVKAFGKDLVLFRTEDGELALLDAFCPHLGAHLGHGGKVTGGSIRCPFHAWEFGTNGKCTAVPYAKRVPNKAEIEKQHVREVNGLVMAWFDVDGAPPSFEIPSIPEYDSEEWTPYLRRKWTLRTHNQEMAENVVDIAHFRYVHGMKIVPQPHLVDASYPILRMETKTVMDTPAGEVSGILSVECHGFGFSTSRFTGLVQTTVIASVTPIDDEYVDVRFSFAVHKGAGADVARGIGKAFTAEIARQLEEDRPIWENKAYLERPMLCDGDGPFGEFRRWCKQFYPDWYIEQAAREFEQAHGLELSA
jgi:3-ketosteroid 9alpha-monooxygenase subunit A